MMQSTDIDRGVTAARPARAAVHDVARTDDRLEGFRTIYPLAPSPADLSPSLDEEFPPQERLPRSGRVRFVAGSEGTGLVTNTTFLDGKQIGDVLTDACSQADGYRFHDCLHLAFALILGWSPATRALMGAKRRSSPALDGTEDGGRAIAVEEGVAALVFAHQAAGSLFVAGGSLWSSDAFAQVNPVVIDTAAIMTQPFAVADRAAQQWAAAIVTGLRAMSAAEFADGDIEFEFDVALNQWVVLGSGSVPTGARQSGADRAVADPAAVLHR